VQLPTLSIATPPNPSWTEDVQAVLVTKWHQRIAVDGAFGVATDEAVANVQRLMGITVDGVVGPATWGVLLAFGRA
jgi:peptidoglycan hydrolase-like protein with peptidoglycan-binding domain